jgi:hypothetical protein
MFCLCCEGCNEKLEFRNVSKHEREVCGFRKVKCKFMEIGCNWGGIAKDQTSHEKTYALLPHASPSHRRARALCAHSRSLQVLTSHQNSQIDFEESA